LLRQKKFSFRRRVGRFLPAETKIFFFSEQDEPVRLDEKGPDAGGMRKAGETPGIFLRAVEK